VANDLSHVLVKESEEVQLGHGWPVHTHEFVRDNMHQKLAGKSTVIIATRRRGVHGCELPSIYLLAVWQLTPRCFSSL
jgi:hypothetical protein